MSNNETITVKEFAEREKITVQAVYKRLKTTLNPYIVKVDNVTYIDYTAYTSANKPPEAGAETEESIKRLYAERLKEVENLTQLINQLKAENADKEKQYIQQVTALTEQHAQTVATLTEQIAAMSAQVTTLTAAVREAHALQAATMKELAAARPAPPQSFWRRLFKR